LKHPIKHVKNPADSVLCAHFRCGNFQADSVPEKNFAENPRKNKARWAVGPVAEATAVREAKSLFGQER
jgi:hypothetical protein